MLLAALNKVNEMYTPAGQPVMFDLQIEAEILGCELKWAEKNPPSVITHPWDAITEIPDLKFSKDLGRIPLLMDVTSNLKEMVGNHTLIFGLFTGPFTLASHLRGTKLYIDMLKNSTFAAQMIQKCCEISYKMIDYYKEAGADVIALVDPVVSQISPRMFKKFLLEPFSQIFAYINKSGLRSSFFVCGDGTKVLPAMCETHPDSIFVDENVNLKEAQTVTNQFNIALGGNIPLTTTMLYGNQQDNMKYVIDLLDELDHGRLIIAPGCDMPYDVPIENAIAVAEAIARPEEIRESLKNYLKPPLDLEIQLPDYSKLERPLIELFTLDSSQCAACKYMLSVAERALIQFPNQVDLIEYKWTELENIVRTQKMGVQHLPSIYIDGQLKWSSIIPSEEEYFAEIQKILKIYSSQ